VREGREGEVAVEVPVGDTEVDEMVEIGGDEVVGDRLVGAIREGERRK
jgi:hypothetical protein